MTPSAHNQTLYVDAGNSVLKAAMRSGKSWRMVAQLPRHSESENPLQNLLEQAATLADTNPNHVVLASVRDPEWTARFTRNSPVEVSVLRSTLIPAGHIRYKTLSTFGVDRYLACLGGWLASGRRAVIVTDAGTACTIDLMNAQGVFLGGVIMPGLQMMRMAPGEGAAGLYEVPVGLPDGWPPDSTTTALQAGSTGSWIHALQGHVQRHLQLEPDACLWLTGGDARVVNAMGSYCWQTSPWLLFDGMYHWVKSADR